MPSREEHPLTPNPLNSGDSKWDEPLLPKTRLPNSQFQGVYPVCFSISRERKKEREEREREREGERGRDGHVERETGEGLGRTPSDMPFSQEERLAAGRSCAGFCIQGFGEGLARCSSLGSGM